MSKRMISILCAVAVAVSVASPVAHALRSETNGRVENIYVYSSTLDKVDVIDLETVLKRALDNNDNLMLLTLRAVALLNKQDDLNTQVNESGGASFNGGRLPETPNELMDSMAQQGIKVDPAAELWIGPMTTTTNKAINQTIQGVGAVASGLSEIIAQQRHQMRSNAHQLETDRFNTFHQYAEAKEGIRLQQISNYVNLLGLKKQLWYMDEYERTVRTELNRAMRLHELGLASDEDIVAAKRALSKQVGQAKVLEENFRLALIQLSFDIGIAYNPDLVIRDIEGIVVAPLERVDTKKLLEQAYQIRVTSNNFDEAMWQRERSVTSNVYGDRYLSTNVTIAGTQGRKTELELTKKIEATYSEANQALQAYTEEARNVEDLRADLRRMEIRYKAGAVSKHEMNAFGLKLKQAEAARDIAALKFYAVQEKAKAMKRGFIS